MDQSRSPGLGYRNTPTSNMPMRSHPATAAEARELQRLHRGRLRICPRSPFLHENFDLQEHKDAMEAAMARRRQRHYSYLIRVGEQRQAEQGRAFPLPGPGIKPAFGGKVFSTNHSAVLLHPTVFVPTFWKGKQPEWIAEWPSRNEMKYEGDDRISTDVLHSRFPPAPRVVGNGTVNWQQRTIIHPEVLDNFYPSLHPMDIEIRYSNIPALQLTDEEGEACIGKELMEMLDPKDIW